jgi:transcription elongation GreA/GreB family factor
MNKKELIHLLQVHLAQELAHLLDAARAAHEAAIHEESKPEDSHDTRSVEASYLAGAQAQRAAEIQQQITMYKFMPVRDYGKGDAICPGSLVELELKKTRAFYFIAPQGGGLVTTLDGKPVQVITPQSPMGEALLGKKVGDTVEVEIRDSTREYKIISNR